MPTTSCRRFSLAAGKAQSDAVLCHKHYTAAIRVLLQAAQSFAFSLPGPPLLVPDSKPSSKLRAVCQERRTDLVLLQVAPCK